MNAHTANRRTGTDTPPGKTLAVSAEALYLVNLLLLPGLAFLALLVLYLIQRRQATPLASNHLAQTTGVSIIGGAFSAVSMSAGPG